MSSLNTWFAANPILTNLLVVVGLLISSWLIGAWLAAAMRVRDYAWKFSCILFALFASVVIIARGWPPKLGIDLGGGAVLVYQVDHAKTEWRPDKLQSLVSAISERVNPGGQKEISVRSLGDDMVQIIMPAVSGATAKEKQAQLEEVKKIIRTTGALEFRIVATRRFDQTLIERAAAARKEACLQNPGDPKTGPEKASIVYGDKLDPYTGRPKEVAKWVPVREAEQRAMMGDDAAIEVYAGKDENGKDKQRLEVLVLAPENDSTDVTGRYIRDARPDNGRQGPVVSFTFNSEGGAKFGKLTGEHVPLDNGAFKFKLAIVLDNILQSAPVLNSAITDRGEIEGDFTPQQVQDLCDIINRGALPAALKGTPEREMITEPTLGAETIHQSFVAMFIAAVAVPLFMIFYYRFAGVVAVAVLSLTILMLVAIMVLVKAPFTLTALAGLALSVGMEVDNNVLIYERLREELRHGAALRMALRNSFHRVGVVIVDANITHVLAAAVLFYVGTEQVKGFAITFLLGALLSIWATMFVAKTIFEVAERRYRIQKIHMLHVIGHTTIDFMHWFKACLTFSVLITVLGLAVAFYRGKGLFDIDFTGGISVQTLFTKTANVQEIRAEIAKHSSKEELPDATVTPVQSENEPKNRRFVFDTANTDGKVVEGLIGKLFEGQLVTAQMKYALAAPESGPSLPEQPKEKSIEKPAAKPTEKPSEKPAEKPAGPSLPAPAREPKPADEPRDMTAPPAPSAAPGATKPAEPKSTAAPATAPNTDGKTSAIDVLPADLASAIEPEVIVDTYFDATAGTADAKSTAKPAAAPEAKTQPAAAKAETAVKPEAKTEAQSVAKPQAAASMPTEAKTETKPTEKAESASVTKAEPSAYETTVAEPIQANLTFTVSMAHMEGTNVVETSQEAKYEKDQLHDLIEQALEANHLPKLTPFDLSNATKSAAADEWSVSFMPQPGAKVRMTPERVQAVLKTVQAEVAKQPYFPGVDNMGSAVATDTRFWACVALVLSWSLIILYLWIRFQGVAFGLAAVIALIHDVLVMLGAIAFSSYLALIPGVTTLTLIEPFKINLTIVAAFLTIIGYSVNDTIVVFDRIREIRGKSPTLTRQMVNDATNQTLSRTVLTSFTVLMVVLILYIFGGQAVHGFAFALFIGVLTGTYSSIYVAAPILLWLLHPKEMKSSSASGPTGSAVRPAR